MQTTNTTNPPSIDVGEICCYCGTSVAFGDGHYVDRIAADADWTVVGPLGEIFVINVDGYMCSDCQCEDCAFCGEPVIDYEIVDGQIKCIDCQFNPAMDND
jgi:hypothetical protein